MPSKFKTREQWLNAFTKRAVTVFKRFGYEIPKNVRCSVGWSSKGARSNRIGECWSDLSSADGTFEIFISPLMDDASRVADILTHELIHATVGLEAGHKKPFVQCMHAVGLTGKATATVAGPQWHIWADPILASLGPLPHAALTPGGNGEKKQTTRMIKCECPDCGFVMRTTVKWLESSENLECPIPACRAELRVG